MLESGELTAPTISEDGSGFFGAATNALYAIDLHSGEELWEFSTEDCVRGSPSITDGLVIAGCDDGNFYAVSAHTGIKEWSFPTDGKVWNPAAVANGLVFFSSEDGSIRAVQASSGRLVWESSMGEFGEKGSHIAVGRGLILVTTVAGLVCALNAGDGKTKWELDAGDVVSPAALWKDRLVVGSHGYRCLECRVGYVDPTCPGPMGGTGLCIRGISGVVVFSGVRAIRAHPDPI